MLSLYDIFKKRNKRTTCMAGLKPFQTAEYVFLALIAFLMPISWRIATYAFAGLFITCVLRRIFENGFKTDKLQSRNKSIYFVFIAFWLIYVISFLYSDNNEEARLQIGKKLLFLILPLFFICSDLSYLSKDKVKKIIYCFVLGILSLLLANAVWAIFDILFNDNEIDRLISYHKLFKWDGNIIPYVHRGYFSIMTCFAMVFCFTEFFENTSRKSKIFNLISTIILIFFPFFLTSRAGILCVICTLFILWIWITFVKKERKIGISSGVIIAATLVVGYFAFPESIERFSDTIENIQNGKSDCRLTIRNGNRTVLSENIMFGVGVGDRNDETVKSYKKYKDEILAKMTPTDNVDLEQFIERRQILLDSIHAKYDNRYSDTVYNYIDSIAGTDSCDYSSVKDNLAEYQTISHCIKHELNAHNQFIDTIISAGIIALAILLSFFFIPVYLWIKNRKFDIVFFSFLFIIAFNSLFESVFERQMGIMFFTFFYLLLFHENFCQQTTDDNSLFIKSAFDKISALVGMIILSPIMLVIFIIHKIVMPKGRFLFLQERIGQYGKPFNIYKIRTMKTANDNVKSSSYVTTADDERILPFGRWLRKTKLDEIVELINVIKGDMSLVGPRPDVSGYADMLTGSDRKILELKPGITGPASLKYINEEEILAKVDNPQQYNDEVIYPDKVKINLDYYHNRTFWGDIAIIFKTIFR